jgi:CubicO group peptidase (beta-lactamase class C family)
VAADTICRLGSMSKPIVAACAMTLVEDCTLRLDDPVDELLPELADMSVLVDPDGPLDDTVAAKRSITARDLLTYTLGTGMVPAEPGTIPIADALMALGQPSPGEWMRQLGTGFGMSVRTRRTHLGPSVGSYGWPGYYGTVWYNDPAEDMTAIFIMQRW